MPEDNKSIDPYDLSHLEIDGDEDLLNTILHLEERIHLRMTILTMLSLMMKIASSSATNVNLQIQKNPVLGPCWEDYFGQTKVKENLKVFIAAAKGRGEPLDHVLLYGPPGLGKTTLAGIIAEMGSNLRVTSGPAIEKAGDLAAILSNLEQGCPLY